MSIEDPFFVVKDEVFKALNKARGLYQRVDELKGEEVSLGREDIEWMKTELRNTLRSVEWDLEDLEETIGIVENNPRKFKIDASEVQSRREFIKNAESEVRLMKEKVNKSKRQATEQYSENKTPSLAQVMSSGSAKYSRLSTDPDSPTRNPVSQLLRQQESMIDEQDAELEQLSSSMKVLKNMSRQIGDEVDEQVVMLDDFNQEMEHTRGKMETTLSKMARVMHLTDDKRQWAAIGALSGILLVVLILLFWL